MLDSYADWLGNIMQATLCDAQLQPRERLNAYLDTIEQNLAAADWRCGCLIGDFSAEMPGSSELLRDKLCSVIERQIGYFEAALAGLSFAGGPQEQRALAPFLVMAWQGALLRTKVQRDPAAVRDFRTVLTRFLP